jgi:trehalose synthase
MWSQLESSMAGLERAMRGRVVWNVSSTARGGGVAEMLSSLIAYSRGAGIDERWAVIEGSADFFAVTKKIHSLLHGVMPEGGPLNDGDRRQYDQATAANAEALIAKVKTGDVAILHDPQPAGLIPLLARRGVHVIWRCHVGVDEPSDIVRGAWRFLHPYLAGAAAYVFSRQAYAWEGLDPSRVAIIAPCIDPFATKNSDLGHAAADGILQASRILDSTDGPVEFVRYDGTRSRVARAAVLTGDALAPDARIVTQVSRWDRLKDHAGVLEAFAQHVVPPTDTCLVLAGPAAKGVADDPEQPQVLGELIAAWRALPAETRRRAVIAELPMEDIEENAAIVNALQRRADVVVQKSLAEGFGLTVAEAMWKSRPVVASRVGGIGDQIEDGRSGLLIDDPHDLAAFGAAIVRLLGDRDLADRLGVQARRRVIGHFMTPSHLIAQGRLIAGLGA